MASTITGQAVANWALPFIKNQPAVVSNLEPALTSANKVMQRLLSAPFRWRWNRDTFIFQTVVETSPPILDYPVTIPDFGFLENVYFTNQTGAPLPPIAIKTSLPVDYTVARPGAIAPQYDDNADDITFRLDKAPDMVYSVSGDYQRKPPIFPSLAFTFSPVPDEFAYLYQTGFLAEISLLVNDARYPIFRREFVSCILGLQDGLDAVAKAMFIESYLGNAMESLRAQQMAGQGVQARAI